MRASQHPRVHPTTRPTPGRRSVRSTSRASVGSSPASSAHSMRVRRRPRSPTSSGRARPLDPRVRARLADPDLAATAETFFELAGNVQATAIRLHLHRATLYYRLDRISTLYHLNLRQSGDHRLLTHLGLKLARLTSTAQGSHVPPGSGGPSPSPRYTARLAAISFVARTGSRFEVYSKSGRRWSFKNVPAGSRARRVSINAPAFGYRRNNCSLVRR